MVANILPTDPTPPPTHPTPPPPTPPPPTDPGMGSLGQDSTFAEHGHFVNQMKGNRKCSNLVANI